MDFTSLALQVIKANVRPIETPQVSKLEQDRKNRLVYDFQRERNNFEMEPLSYEKIRWPMFRDICMRRRDLPMIPLLARQVHKLVGLKDASQKQKQESSETRLSQSSSKSRETSKERDINSSTFMNKDQKQSTEQMNQTGAAERIAPQDIVIFDGNFECANIDQVRKRENKTYDVWMRNDTNGSQELQWFMFRMRNTGNFCGTIKVSIVNFTKTKSLFLQGMKPSFWSKINNGNQGPGEVAGGWIQAGIDIKYEPSIYASATNELNPFKQKNYMMLTFDYRFENMNDEIFCAYTVPYTYTQMQTHLKQLKLLSSSYPYEFIRFESMGTSLGGLDIPILKIANQNQQTKTFVDQPIILIIGRQHPGETYSSFIIHGFINYLCSQSLLCHKLRDQYEIWVIPIINPDGVVTGNYRSNIQGKDMNRHFYADEDHEGYRNRALEVEILRSKLKETFPPDQTKRFKLFLDIHGHSAQRSIFIYAPQPDDENDQIYIQRLPKILDNCSPYFMLQNCKFNNEKFKRNCARLAFYRDFSLLDTYTIESSCFGYQVKGSGKPADPVMGTEEEPPEIVQLGMDSFMDFSQHLLQSLCRHLQVTINDLDRAGMLFGFDIPVDFYLGIEEIQKPKIKPLKKKKGGQSKYRSKRPDSSTSSLRSSIDSQNSTRQGFLDKSKPPVSLVKQSLVGISQMRSPNTQQITLDVDYHTANDKLIHTATNNREKFDKTQADQLKKQQLLALPVSTQPGFVKQMTIKEQVKHVTKQYQDNSSNQMSTEDTAENYGRIVSSTSTELQHLNSLFSRQESQPPNQIFKAQDYEKALLDHYRKQGGFGSQNTADASPDPMLQNQEQQLPPELAQKYRRRNNKVVITIKAQNADGTQMNVSPEFLKALQQQQKNDQNQGSAQIMQQQQPKTVFKTAINVDRTDIIKKNVDAQQSNMFAQLIQELYQKQQQTVVQTFNQPTNNGVQRNPSVLLNSNASPNQKSNETQHVVIKTPLNAHSSIDQQQKLPTIIDNNNKRQDNDRNLKNRRPTNQSDNDRLILPSIASNTIIQQIQNARLIQSKQGARSYSQQKDQIRQPIPLQQTTPQRQNVPKQAGLQQNRYHPSEIPIQQNPISQSNSSMKPPLTKRTVSIVPAVKQQHFQTETKNDLNADSKISPLKKRILQNENTTGKGNKN